MTDAPSTEISTPPHVPDFDLLRPIGEGGFGRVWLARNRTTGQPRAVKLIPLQRSGSPDPAGREIASLARLEANVLCRHPNLLVIHHVGQTADHLFYVMDLADDLSGNPGSSSADYRPATLHSRLRGAPLPPDAIARHARQLLSALACLHRSGMVHRDVKPANCLFVGGELKLGDFGLLAAANLPTSRLGTLRYMPPDGVMDARADVYAAGLVIYEMLTGLEPDRFPSLGEAASRIAAHAPLARWNQVVLRACDPNPDHRFADAAAMLAEAPAEPHVPASRVRRRSVLLAGLAAAAGVAALTAWWREGVPGVDVNFLTEPYEAQIYLDGRLQTGPNGTAYRTPCTIPGLRPRPFRVVFAWEDREEVVDLGVVDFAQSREVSLQVAP